MAPASRLAFERETLARAKLSDRVIDTIQAARRPATLRIYETTWGVFRSWCLGKGLDPAKAAAEQVLEFLQDGLDKGLAPNTLRRQVAALSSVLDQGSGRSLSQTPMVRNFLKGATNLRPPVVHRYPTWDLPKVLRALTREPFEPLGSVPIDILTWKVAFLLAITSARRISELAALSVRKDLCVFHEDRVVLRLDPTFIPKINSWFHRAQEIVLPKFSLSQPNTDGVDWSSLDVRRALHIYIARTREFRKTEALLVAFQDSKRG